MWIRIKSITRDVRYPVSAIRSMEVNGQSAVTKKWYITLRVSGADVKFAWDTEKEMRQYEEYLDKILDVKVI